MNKSLAAVGSSFRELYEILKKDVDEYERKIKTGRWSRSMGINWALLALLLEGVMKKLKVKSKSGHSDLPFDDDFGKSSVKKKVTEEIAAMLQCYLSSTDGEHEYSVIIVMKDKNSNPQEGKAP